MSLTIETELGVIKMKFRADAAPTTAAYISKQAQSGIFDGCTFYRSDFVIQCGLHGTTKSAPENLKVNETSGESTSLAYMLSCSLMQVAMRAGVPQSGRGCRTREAPRR